MWCPYSSEGLRFAVPQDSQSKTCLRSTPPWLAFRESRPHSEELRVRDSLTLLFGRLPAALEQPHSVFAAADVE